LSPRPCQVFKDADEPFQKNRIISGVYLIEPGPDKRVQGPEIPGNVGPGLNIQGSILIQKLFPVPVQRDAPGGVILPANFHAACFLNRSAPSYRSTTICEGLCSSRRFACRLLRDYTITPK
jgi:hypothetical protein